MIRKIVLPIIALIGIAFAIYTVRASQKVLPPAKPIAQPPTGDFESQIAGAGLVEAASENIAIGTIVPGVVTVIHVEVGQTVKKGDKLFTIDTRDLDAQLAVKQAAVDAADARLAKLRQSPRPEELPAAEAKVAQLQASLADRQDQQRRLEGIRITSSGAVSIDELNRAKYAVDVAAASLNEAQAELALIKAGTWAPDMKIAEAELASAKAEVEALRIERSRREVLAPIDGTILQVKVRAGEYASAGVLSTPLMLIGQVATKNVRVDIDENDAWRLRSGSPAVGSLRGNSALKTKLTFVRIEPYVIPKRSLTGESTERVDTRVLQVIYRIDSAEIPIYVGQQMDVFIDASGADAKK
jgi:multidrug resistance efflux pump